MIFFKLTYFVFTTKQSTTMRTLYSTLVAFALVAVFALNANAQGPAPFAGGVKLQQAGITAPANGLTLTAKNTVAYTANVGLAWVQPAGNGILKVANFAANAGDITIGALNLASNGAGGDVTGILGVTNGGTGASSLTGNGVLTMNAGGTALVSTSLTNGQLLIGSTGAAPVAATLTAGTGITITSVAGSITIATNSANITNKARIALSATAVTYAAQAPPAGFTITATTVINITVLEAGGFPITATVTAITPGAPGTFDFVISGYPTVASFALVTYQN